MNMMNIVRFVYCVKVHMPLHTLYIHLTSLLILLTTYVVDGHVLLQLTFYVYKREKDLKQNRKIVKYDNLPFN